MTERKITGDALDFWRRKRAMTQSQLAEKSGVTQNYISQIISGIRSPSIEILEQLATALGISLAEFFSCKEASLPDVECVPLVKAVPNAKTGGLETDADYEGLYAFHSGFLRERRGNPDTMRLFLIDGDSMEPTLQRGDMIMINQGMKDIASGNIYLIRLEGELMVKRLENRPGILLIRSDNPMYEPISIRKHDESLDFELFGRMVWSCREY